MYNLCAFSTTDDKYVASAITSLLTIRKWNDKIPLFIVSRKLNQESKKLINNHDIKIVEVNLDNLFDKVWDYSVECYYLFAGPSIFYELGFTHSLYIDGDIYCNNDPLIDLAKIKMFGGVANGPLEQILKNDWDKICSNWTKPLSKKDRLQTGVVYFNNKTLTEYSFLQKIGQLFSDSIKIDAPRKGDDSLFALFQFVYQDLDYIFLPKNYNFIEQIHEDLAKKDWLTENDFIINEVVFYHFTTSSPKPWEDKPSYPNYTCKYFSYKWRHRLIDNFNKTELLKYFPRIANSLQENHLRFYWWPSSNVGDLITPYYLKKVCKIKNINKFSINEQQITEIEKLEKKKKVGLFGRKKISEKVAQYCVSTGSVIRLCGEKALIFGSGIRSNDQKLKDSFVRCVRGPLTRKRFLESGFECPPIYGDPGLLLPRFYTSKKIINNRNKLGIIPHFTEYAQVKKLYKNDTSVVVINMGCGDIELVIDIISSCRATVSSSLHGLVFSHAYNVPTRRIIFSDMVYGDGTKYDDYYQGIGLSQKNVINATGFKKISTKLLLKQAVEKLENFDDSRLFDSLFFDENGIRKSTYYPY